jgi:trehalose utilization protein
MKHLMMAVAVTGLAATLMAAPKKTVVVWSEGTAPKNVYPKDINTAIAEGLKESPLMKDWDVVVASISDPDQGISDELLNKTDVLIWWGHTKHGDVKDALVDKIEKRVKEEGMGFISLHSSHFAKPNKRLMGTPCTFAAYVGDCKENEMIVAMPDHPIVKGVAKNFTFENHERYSDPYAVPPTDEVPIVGVQVHKNGTRENAKMGFCWTIGKGRFFYFQPGHETNPIFFHPEVRKIMANTVLWAAPKK